MRNGFETARDSGVNLAFMGANAAMWQVQMQDSGRTVMSYKSLYDPNPDPLGKTAMFRELTPPRYECGLIGIQAQGVGLNWPPGDYTVVATSLSDPWMQDTASPRRRHPGIVSVESDTIPGNQTAASSCSHDLTVFFHRQRMGGDKDGNADATRYTAPSGATVFASGSHQFSWGLDDFTINPDQGHGFVSQPLQRFIRNAFDSMTRLKRELRRGHADRGLSDHSGCMDAHPEPGLSIVVPLHNEEACIAELGRRLIEVTDGLPETTEFILVDDGSTDGTPALIRELAAGDPRFRFLQLSRSFGHQIALTAGLEAARGSAVVTMDGDLQHPPECIPEFVARWREGYDVVYGVMQERVVPTRFKSWSAKMFYRVLRSMTDVAVQPAAGDFRLVDRRALDEFLRLREHHRYLRGMFSWLGYRQIGVDYASPARFGGESKYTLWMMMGLAADALLSFSKSPLRFVIKVAFAVAVLSVLFAAGSLISKLSASTTRRDTCRSSPSWFCWGRCS